jgi:hypothetical protein
MIQQRLAAVLVIVAFGVAGCIRGPASVAGKVTYRGKPVTTGTVYVAGSDGVQAVSAINPDGTYQIISVAAGPAGIGVISLKPTAARPRTSKRAPVAALPPPVTGWFAIPDRYADPTASGLNAQLKSGPNDHNIELQ